MLGDEAVGVGPWRPRRELLVVKCAGMRAHFLQRLVELLLVQLVDEARVGLARRIVEAGLGLAAVEFVDRDEGRAHRRHCAQVRWRRLGFFGGKALQI